MVQTYNVGSRSLFVTVTAWVFIALATLASGAALVQNASVLSLLPEWQARASRQPWLTGLLLAYLPYVAAGAFAVCVAMLACSIGLLLRLEWARRVFIGLIGVAIFANLGGLWLQQELVASLVSGTALPGPQGELFDGFVVATRIMAGAVTLGGCLLLVWIIRRLMSSSVRQEFA